ncbi:MAG TPA: Gfo/Idh/MocA family oxidoreductase [Candidatus Hydrogenedentes bacterium]|nr:Gfo/Idh/MocA family oxidoreductase [Candidatus Hydrogenedentota bacterium]
MANIGIMSFAHMHAYSYAACLKQLPGCELTAVWDDNIKRGRTAAKQFETKFVANLDAFLDSSLDGVIITSENMKHRPMAERCAAAGKWILCEKPIAPSVADAQAMVQACKKAKVGLGTALPCRFSPPLMEACTQIQTGEFGEIVAASCTNHGQSPGGWFADDALSGGGATMDHTVHVADLLRWILKKEFVSVYCELGNQLHNKEFKTDDVGSLQLEMEGGVQVSHVASWSRAKSFPTWGDVTIEFIGTKGVLWVDAFNQKINVYNDAAMKAEWAYWGGNPDLGLVADFVRAVEERREPTVTGLDGLRATEVTAAAYQAAKTKKRVPIKRTR